jgi:hypothetical protein
VNDGIRRAALRSAAKVAFGASLCWGVTVTACGGKSVGEATDGSGDGDGPGESGPTPSVGGGENGRAGGSSGGNEATGGVGGSGAVGGSAAVGGSGAMATGGSAGEIVDASVGVDAETPDAGGGPELACVAPLGAFDAGIEPVWSREDFACCNDYVSSKVPDGGAELDAGTLAGDPSLVNCCRYVTSAYYDLVGDGGFITWPGVAYEVCCIQAVLSPNEQPQSFCSPWGPPVPPMLDAEREAVA